MRYHNRKVGGPLCLFQRAVIKVISERKKRGCVSCGKRHNSQDPLEFHHRNPASKRFNISEAYKSVSTLTLMDVEKEMDKCDILCHECHQRADQEAGVKRKR